VRGLDGFNPCDNSIKDFLEGGVTCINTGPGSANVISGEALVVKPVGNVVDEMVIRCPSGLKVALGENPKRVHGQQGKRMQGSQKKKTKTDLILSGFQYHGFLGILPAK
jgi:imidazolonepropionase-like amidohydrolase